MKRILLPCVILASVLSTGCASTSVGTDVGGSNKIQAELVKGKTTKAEVISLYGKPQTQMTNSDGTETYIYSFMKNDVSVNAATYIPIVGLFAGGSEVQMNTSSLSITFTDSVISNYSYSTSEHKGEYSTFGGYQGQ